MKEPSEWNYPAIQRMLLHALEYAEYPEVNDDKAEVKDDGSVVFGGSECGDLPELFRVQSADQVTAASDDGRLQGLPGWGRGGARDDAGREPADD